jgi:putative cardiolipin synthase
MSGPNPRLTGRVDPAGVRRACIDWQAPEVERSDLEVNDTVRRTRHQRRRPRGVSDTMGSIKRAALYLVIAAVFPALTACGDAMPTNVERTPSTAFTDHESTRIGGELAERAAQHPGDSGFAIIRYGRQALTARVALADLAERTLDVQYYIWEADATGRILAERLVRAAERGVRVRVLVDDMNMSGRDARIAALDAHPNIEIRLFNPFGNRKHRALDFLTDMSRVNHRMHNKIMVMDNAVALVGGRNVGAHYFEAHTESNFRDLDIAAVGPIVREVSDVFDRFWNGEWSVPISAVADRPFTEDDHRTAIAEIRQQIEQDDYPFPVDVDVEQLRGELSDVFDRLIWAKGKVIWDDPSSIYDGVKSGRMNEALYDRLGRLESELLIESAYFVARDRGVEMARDLEKRGVHIRVLTNSLAANDVLAAHGGYAKFREDLIKAGVELYELRPDPGPIRKTPLVGKSKAALHTKAIVFDRRDVFIGSFNLDPRSGSINTEAGLYVESPELAQQVIDYMDAGVSPENAYRVIVDDDGDLRWIVEIDGQRVDYDKDPMSTWWQRAVAKVVQWLPIEEQL